MTVEWDTENIISDVRKAAVRGVADGLESVRTNAVKKILSGPKTGVIYKRRGVSHQASAPGESPANDTGRLAQSARTELDAGEIKGIVNFSTAYAAALEFGTNDGKILPRPYARPALEEEREGIEKTIADGIRAVIK